MVSFQEACISCLTTGKRYRLYNSTGIRRNKINGMRYYIEFFDIETDEKIALQHIELEDSIADCVPIEEKDRESEFDKIEKEIEKLKEEIKELRR